MNEYTFSYQTREALHLSEKERRIVLDCFHKIRYELEQGTDKYNKKLIASNIELFINYCLRFYDRQFISRSDANHTVLQKFETFLNEYFSLDKPQTLGLRAVIYCAEQQHLSSYYFGDMAKKEMGKTALEYIQFKVINLAKKKLVSSEQSLSEIAYELDFRYPQHFTRLFKQHSGQTPKEFRNLMN